MAYVAMKPCRFAGTAYKIGDAVPASALVDGAADRLLKQEVLALAPEAEAPVLTETVTISDEEVELTITQDGLDLNVAVLQATVEAAAPIIAAATDVDGLKLLSVLDSRKGVTDAVAARLAELEE